MTDRPTLINNCKLSDIIFDCRHRNKQSSGMRNAKRKPFDGDDTCMLLLSSFYFFFSLPSCNQIVLSSYRWWGCWYRCHCCSFFWLGRWVGSKWTSKLLFNYSKSIECCFCAVNTLSFTLWQLNLHVFFISHLNKKWHVAWEVNAWTMWHLIKSYANSSPSLSFLHTVCWTSVLWFQTIL